MASVVRLLPSPPPPEPEPAIPARWRLALAVTRAVGLASAGFVFASFAAMTVGLLSCGDGVEWPLSRATEGENCPVFRAAFTVFRVSAPSMAVASRVLDLLRKCLARSEAKKQKAAAKVKNLDYAIIFEHLVPSVCIFLVLVGILLGSHSPKGSLMETVGSAIFYVGLGMMALIVVVLGMIALIGAIMAVGLCWMMAMEVWEYYSTVETKAQSPEEKEL